MVSLGGYPEISGICAESSSESYDDINQYMYYIYISSSRCLHKRKQRRQLPSIQHIHRSMVYVSRTKICQLRGLSWSIVASVWRLDVNKKSAQSARLGTKPNSSHCFEITRLRHAWRANMQKNGGSAIRAARRRRSLSLNVFTPSSLLLIPISVDCRHSCSSL